MSSTESQNSTSALVTKPGSLAWGLSWADKILGHADDTVRKNLRVPLVRAMREAFEEGQTVGRKEAMAGDKMYRFVDSFTGTAHLIVAADVEAARLQIPWCRERAAYAVTLVATHFHVEVEASPGVWMPTKKYDNAQPFLYTYEDAVSTCQVFQKACGTNGSSFRVAAAGVLVEPL